MEVEVIARSSRGDTNRDVPLHTLEGSDFFTEEIFESLSTGEADIAVHSLKDMSSAHFFGSNTFAVVDRDDARDIAIFRSNAKEKIKNGDKLIIGTCSPRREEMAIGFLQKALPQDNNFIITTKSIRGNVDTRLRKLDEGEYDGIILATAGLNRLLRSDADAATIRSLLHDKLLMLLPLIECVPAPCQGAIVAEAIPSNEIAIMVLNAINEAKLEKDCIDEKKTASRYGAGCIQRFGVTSLNYGANRSVYAAGTNEVGESFSHWSGLPSLDFGNKNLFTSTEYMGKFFDYEFQDDHSSIEESIVYVANYKAIRRAGLLDQLRSKKVWAAGTKTWFELAKKGIWVEGCADAFGLESLVQPWSMPLFNINRENVALITNTQSVHGWATKGWKVYGTYDFIEKQSPEIVGMIRNADVLFWTSFRQYEQYKDQIKENAIHACPYGETAELLRAAGIEPVVFPNIKAFQQWRQISSRSRSVA